MATAASTIITKVRDLIQDSSSVRWTEAELLRWISDGQRELGVLKPEAVAVTASKALAGGVSKQSLTSIDSAAFQLMDVVRNMGSNGTTVGRAIRPVAKEVLDAQIPTWHSDANADGYIKHYVFDPRDPLTFFVWPISPATWYVELVYAKTPTDIASAATNLGVPDVYANAIVNYTVYRAYAKDEEYAGDSGVSAWYYNAFLASIGAKHNAELARLPQPLSKNEGNPNVA